MSTQFIGLGENDFVQGGLLSDVDVEITTVQFRGWDYNGAVSEDILAVRMELTILDEKGHASKDATPTEQFFSAGPKLEEVSISDDGFKILPGSKSGLTKGSNLHIFLGSLWSLGMPKDYLADGDISKLQKTKCHVIRVPAPKREGLTIGKKDYEPQVLVINKIISAPWDKGSKKTTGSASTKPAANTTTAPTGGQVNGAADTSTDVQSVAESNIKEVLTATPVIAAAQLAIQVFRLHQNTNNDRRTAIVNAAKALLKNEEWLILNKINMTDGAFSMET